MDSDTQPLISPQAESNRDDDDEFRADVDDDGFRGSLDNNRQAWLLSPEAPTKSEFERQGPHV